MTLLRPFGPDDLESIVRHGISLEDAERQIRWFVDPPLPTRIDRACKIGDGIEQIPPERHAALIARSDAAAAAGRVTKFVPASGAATRMFSSLLALGPFGSIPSLEVLEKRARAGDRNAAAAVRLVGSVHRLPFRDALAASMSRRGLDLAEAAKWGDARSIVEEILSPDRLGLARRPKGLIPFHDYDQGARTPLEEHLVEAGAYARDRDGRCRVHLTVSPEHRSTFAAFGRARAPAHESRLGARLEVTYSTQSPSTDTIAVDRDNRPIRRPDGNLLFRPGGHGALIENLQRLEGDVVFLKNIDNVVQEHVLPLLVHWKKILAGRLLEIELEAHALIERLRGGVSDERSIAAAFAFVRTTLGRADDVPPPELDREGRRAAAIDILNRPTRVAGVVANVGEPGGGPFWVTGQDGKLSPQVVEASEIDAADLDQRRVLESATHFNPVDIVCLLRGADGRAHGLDRYVDPYGVFISEKSWHGTSLKALERPGLWNGAMAGWNTVFVEVPLETFAPVKTVLDLLRPEHQPPR